MRDVIAHYHADKAFVEREVFKLPVTATAELVLDDTEYFFDSVSKILEHLWFKMDVNAVEKFIDGMTVYCEKQGMGIENFEVGLKELMLCFRSCAIDYITATSGKTAAAKRSSRISIEFSRVCRSEPRQFHARHASAGFGHSQRQRSLVDPQQPHQARLNSEEQLIPTVVRYDPSFKICLVAKATKNESVLLLSLRYPHSYF